MLLWTCSNRKEQATVLEEQNEKGIRNYKYSRNYKLKALKVKLRKSSRKQIKKLKSEQPPQGQA